MIMSIPTRFNVYGPGMLIKRNLSIFTLSYGTDINNRNVWLHRFREAFKNITPKDKEKYCPWMDTFDDITVELGLVKPFWFTRRELIDDKEEELS
jgi:hypothetical protein